MRPSAILNRTASYESGTSGLKCRNVENKTKLAHVRGGQRRERDIYSSLTVTEAGSASLIPLSPLDRYENSQG